MPELLAEGWIDAVCAALAAVDVPEAADGSALITVSSAPTGSLAVFHGTVSCGALRLSAGRHPYPDVVLGWEYDDLLAAWRGELSIEAAYMSARLKLDGDRVLLFDGWRPLIRSSELRSALAPLREP